MPHQTLLSFPARLGMFSGLWEQLHLVIHRPQWLDLPNAQQLLFSSEGRVSPRMTGNRTSKWELVALGM